MSCGGAEYETPAQGAPIMHVDRPGPPGWAMLTVFFSPPLDLSSALTAACRYGTSGSWLDKIHMPRIKHVEDGSADLEHRG